MITLKQVVDIVTRRPQYIEKIETSRMQLDEISTPAYERVMEELSRLKRVTKNTKPH